MVSDRYFDYAAATPTSAVVIAKLNEYLSDSTFFANPSSLHVAGRKASDELELLRNRAAKIFAVKPNEVIFVSGATEANNLAIKGVLGSDFNERILISPTEHASVLSPAKNYQVDCLKLNQQGVIDQASFKDQISNDIRLVSIIHTNNETGLVSDFRVVKPIVESEKRQRKETPKDNIYLHSDASQAFCYEKILPNQLGLDLVSINGAKMFGLKQTGLLIVKSGIKINPIIEGGGQELNIRSGTENIAFAAALVAALEDADNLRNIRKSKILSLKQTFEEKLSEQLPNVEIVAKNQKRSPHISLVIIPGVSGEDLMYYLSSCGFSVSTGAACSASSDLPSHVLLAMGYSIEKANCSIRVSFGDFNTENSVIDLVNTIVDYYNKITNGH